MKHQYDIIIVGAGHAGVEAAFAAHKMGSKVLLLTISLDSISMLACNPSIGGTGKGHLVREVDALGGLMALVTDQVTLQSKMLNTAKGPAVHSLRVQADKFRYHTKMKETIENIPGLHIQQAEVSKLLVQDRQVTGVLTTTGRTYEAKAVLLATGTYLSSKVFIGNSTTYSGPNGMKASYELAENLKELGIYTRRFKTGTPARVHKDSIDYSKLTIEWGDEKPEPFSFLNDEISYEELPCYLGYTTKKSHRIIEENLYQSAMFSGEIEGPGPRYCPSIEVKITRFADKDQHQLFIEPEGRDTKEMYVQGMSNSLPEDIQEEFYKSIPGLENVRIMRPANAIEYDCIDSRNLKLSLESKNIENLFFAGQINGSSGYEEAAAQGLMAGINAHLKINGKEPFILRRDEAYIGVLIDDLVTKGTEEPFRMMTSRAEYRLILRQDNADLRLTQKGYELGIVSEERYQKTVEKRNKIEAERKRIENLLIPKEKLAPLFDQLGYPPPEESLRFAQLLKRAGISYEQLEELCEENSTPSSIKKFVEIEIKYEGYIDKQRKQIDKFNSIENKKIPADIDYDLVKGLRQEGLERLKALRPENLGQASRISGVNPADISVLLIYMEAKRRNGS